MARLISSVFMIIVAIVKKIAISREAKGGF
jgi:hypothetical protein